MADGHASKSGEPAADPAKPAESAAKKTDATSAPTILSVDKSLSIEAAMYTYEALRSASATVVHNVMIRVVKAEPKVPIVLLHPTDRGLIRQYRQFTGQCAAMQALLDGMIKDLEAIRDKPDPNGGEVTTKSITAAVIIAGLTSADAVLSGIGKVAAHFITKDEYRQVQAGVSDDALMLFVTKGLTELGITVVDPSKAFSGGGEAAVDLLIRGLLERQGKLASLIARAALKDGDPIKTRAVAIKVIVDRLIEQAYPSDGKPSAILAGAGLEALITSGDTVRLLLFLSVIASAGVQQVKGDGPVREALGWLQMRDDEDFLQGGGVIVQYEVCAADGQVIDSDVVQAHTGYHVVKEGMTWPVQIVPRDVHGGVKR